MNVSMQTTESDSALEEGVRVLVWRFAQLVAAGYSCDQAVELSAEPGVDLHQAVRLLRLGCPAQLALAILL